MATFNNTNLETYINYITNVIGLDIPDVQEYESDILQQHGNFYVQTFYRPRIITLECVLLASSNKNIYERLDDLKKFIVGVQGEKNLQLNNFTDRFIKCHYTGSMNIQQTGSSMRFTINFKASDPFFYSNVLVNTTLNNNSNTTIDNIGSFFSNDIVLELNLPEDTDILITNNTTNESLTLRNTIGGTITVRVDFKNNRITSPDLTTNYIKFFKNGTYFNLAPGNNVITLTNATGTNKLIHRHCWI